MVGRQAIRHQTPQSLPAGLSLETISGFFLFGMMIVQLAAMSSRAGHRAGVRANASGRC